MATPPRQPSSAPLPDAPRIPTPLSPAEALAVQTSVARTRGRRRYHRYEEASMSAVDADDAIHLSSIVSPPVDVASSRSGAAEPLLPVISSSSSSSDAPAGSRGAQRAAHGGGVKSRGADTSLRLAANEGQPHASSPQQRNHSNHHNNNIHSSDDSGREAPDAARAGSAQAPRDFQCPQVPPMVIALLVCTALVQGFSASAVSLFINRDLAFGPVQVTRYWMYVSYTAWLQPLIGYLSDAVVLRGEKRRPLFVVAAAGNTLIFLYYCFGFAEAVSYRSFLVLSLVSQFCTMGLYIPLNGLIVEVGRHDAETEEESMARMSAIMSKTMVWRSIGGLAGNVLQTFLVISISVRGLLGVTGALFFVLVPLVLFAPQQLFVRAGTQNQNFYRRVAEAGRLVWRSFDVHDLRSDGFCFVLVLGFVFVYTMIPDAGSVYSNYLYGAFAFPSWFYSMNGCIGYLGSIAGAYVFSLWMDHRARQEASGGARTSLFFVFMIGSFAWAFGYITNLLLCTGFITDTLGIRAGIYIPVDNFFMSMFVRFAFMPTLTMAAEHAPKYFEATTFEVFSVASIGGGTISSLITSFMAEGLGITRENYSRLDVLILISIVLKLLPIPLAYVLPERRTGVTELPTIDGEEGEEEGRGGEEGGGGGAAAAEVVTVLPFRAGVGAERRKAGSRAQVEEDSRAVQDSGDDRVEASALSSHQNRLL